MADIYTVVTKNGYRYKTSEPEKVSLGKRVPLPTWQPEEVNPLDDKMLRFYGQVFAQQMSWDTGFLAKFDIHSLAYLPDIMFQQTTEGVEKFIIQLIAQKVYANRHTSSTTKQVSPEIWLFVKHEDLAQDIRLLLWQLGIRTRLAKHKLERVGWVVKTSGRPSYWRIRPLLLQSNNPKLRDFDKRLDSSIVAKDSDGNYRTEFEDVIEYIEDEVEQGDFIEGLQPSIENFPYGEV